MLLVAKDPYLQGNTDLPIDRDSLSILFGSFCYLKSIVRSKFT